MSMGQDKMDYDNGIRSYIGRNEVIYEFDGSRIHIHKELQVGGPSFSNVSCGISRIFLVFGNEEVKNMRQV